MVCNSILDNNKDFIFRGKYFVGYDLMEPYNRLSCWWSWCWWRWRCRRWWWWWCFELTRTWC